MNIKEIVLEAGHSTVPAYWLSDEKPIACSTSNFERLVSFAEALISAYKAELLKEVGEPIAIVGELSEPTRSEVVDKGNPLGRYLYTSDQVAAAILKATKPLEEKLSWLDYTEKMNKALGVEIEELTAQFAATQGQIANETAEAIAEYCRNQDHYCLATEIKNEAWKEFK